LGEASNNDMSAINNKLQYQCSKQFPFPNHNSCSFLQPTRSGTLPLIHKIFISISSSTAEDQQVSFQSEIALFYFKGEKKSESALSYAYTFGTVPPQYAPFLFFGTKRLRKKGGLLGERMWKIK
jgi:hypothetical protein